jgi:hypothetical protein
MKARTKSSEPRKAQSKSRSDDTRWDCITSITILDICSDNFPSWGVVPTGLEDLFAICTKDFVLGIHIPFLRDFAFQLPGSAAPWLRSLCTSLPNPPLVKIRDSKDLQSRNRAFSFFDPQDVPDPPWSIRNINQCRSVASECRRRTTSIPKLKLKTGNPNGWRLFSFVCRILLIFAHSCTEMKTRFGSQDHAQK